MMELVLVRNKVLNMNTVRVLYERILVSISIYGSETLTLHDYDESRGRAVGIDFLRRALI